ncbi:hypothetical protein HDU98_004768 [Podochytrium sp. JEL0797]|nr:hypothetical protein HDU98_004768 [Podochytrium sp. JEL0797]
MGSQRFDVLILGATGFTGKFVARDFYHLKQKNDPRVSGLTWAVGGRNAKKIQETLEWMHGGRANAASMPAVVVVDVGDAESLRAAVSSARVVINCVGPFRFSGVEVVTACVEAGTSYVDISGEPEFIERILVLSGKAHAADVTVVPCCGFDSVPADLGNLVVKQEFKNRGYTASQVEMFINVTHGPSGAVGNYATYESAVYSLANASVLRALRQKAARAPLATIGKKLPLYGSARFEKLFTKMWCVPFFGADASVVRISQQLVQNKTALQATQFNAYFSIKSVFGVMGLAFFGASMYYLSASSWGRKLLLKYPRFFSIGMFSKSGPNDQQIKEGGFISTFCAKGFKKIVSANEVDSNATPEYEMVMKVTGPESGYVTTPICAIACALQIVQDRKHKTGLIPRGVFTPAAAFEKVAFGEKGLIAELEKGGISFIVQSERHF